MAHDPQPDRAYQQIGRGRQQKNTPVKPDNRYNLRPADCLAHGAALGHAVIRHQNEETEQRECKQTVDPLNGYHSFINVFPQVTSDVKS